ncbi:hypothetical protein [Cohnella cellulosilytica]
MMDERIQLPQSSETPIQLRSGPNLQYRYGYARSSECREADEPGQDYLTFVESEESLSFVLCDGVSQSYYGDFAAKFVGDRLLEWLLDGEAYATETPSEWQRRLNRYMCEVAADAEERLKVREVSPDMHEWLRDVLAEKKKRGSATMYCGGRIDFPGTQFPDGRLLLAWQGDIRCRIWREREELTQDLLGNKFRTDQQWNSVVGPIGGMPHLIYSSLLQGGTKGELLLYSDGFQALDRYPSVSDMPIQELFSNEAGHPSSDDISFLQAIWDYTPR